MIIFLVVSVFFSGYRTDCSCATYVTLTVLVVVVAEIGEASVADITDVITVIIYESVVISIHGLSTVVAMSVIVTVGTLKRLPASVTLVITIGALV